MYKLYYYFIIFSLLTIVGCSKSATDFGNEKEIIIAGKISHFDKKELPKTLKIIRRDLFELNESYAGKIDNKGVFKIRFPLPYKQDFYLEYNGEIINLLASPGDSIFFEIDGNLISKNKGRERIDYLHFADDYKGKTNYAINQFMNELPMEQNGFKAIKDKNPGEYKKYIREREKIHLNSLDRYISEHKPTKLFERWALDYIKYLSWEDLLGYLSLHPYINGTKPNDFIIPDDYTSFLKEYDMDDKEMFTIARIDFMYEFFNYSQIYPEDAYSELENLLNDKKHIEALKMQTKIRGMHFTGFTKEWAIAKDNLEILLSNQIELFEAIHDSTNFSCSYFQTLINTTFQETKKYLSGKLDKEHFTSINSPCLTDLLKEFTEKYKGKVVYLDFWATWCAPCIQAFPNLAKVRKYYKEKEKDVAFVFFAALSNENEWRQVVEKHSDIGDHYFLTNDQYNILSGYLGITSFPHSVLIDSEGNILLKKGPHSSDVSSLIQEIDRELEKNAP